MAQAISENLKNSLNRAAPVYKKTIELYRLAWSGSAYIFDSPIDITEYLTEDSDGRIMWKLDKEEYGVFNLDNVTLTFRNDRNQWKQGNPKGLFPSGKLINQSKIVIKIGAQLADGTFETTNTFSGYISGDPEYSPEDKKVSMTLVSAMSIFDKRNAEEISTLVEDELLGEDSGDTFTTANNGVGIVVTVKRGPSLAGSTEIKPTTDYTLSYLNTKGSPLTVTLVTALTAGEKLYISYRYWYQDKKLEWLAEQVMALCGISSYSIIPAVFQTNIENTWARSSEAEWNAGTLQNIDTASLPGSFRQRWFKIDDFADGDYTTNLLWEVMRGTWSAATNNLVCNTFSYAGSENWIQAQPGTTAYGTWEFKAQAVTSAGAAALQVFFVNYGTYLGATYSYYLTITASQLSLFFNNNGSVVTIGMANVAVTTADTITITRTAAGLFTVYVNGGSVISGTNTDLEYGNGRIKLLASIGLGTNSCIFGDFWYSHDVVSTGHVDAAPVLVTDVLDTAGFLTAWGKIYLTYTLYGGSVTIETYSSDSSDFSTDNDPAGWVAISGTGDILSDATLRYLKVRVTLNKEEYTLSEIPIVDALLLYYYTSSTEISLLNLTGMTCRQVMDKLAEMPAYEMGFRADDSFVYQSRITTGEPVLDLRSGVNIKTVRNLADGIERVYNRVVADYGIYRTQADATTDTEPNSVTKYGTREYSVGSNQLLPAENVNLAYAVAPTILAYTKTPRRRCTVETKFILHLELGDKVTVYYDEPTALRRWKWGDTNVHYGDPDLEYHTEAIVKQRYNLWGVEMRVEGIELDFQNWTTSFDLVEVV